jgi:acetyltransferase-like isoleucine patch superfamily enzyme
MTVGRIAEYLLSDLYTKCSARLFTLLVSKCFYRIGKGSRVASPFRFKNLGKVSIGNNVNINRFCWIHTVKSAHYDKNEVLLRIGDGSAIGMNSTISAAFNVTIAENVFTARNIFISDHGHAFEDINTPIKNQGIRKISPVIIGPDSWIGQNASILPGVTLGKHCVIGSNSVVTRSFPDYSIIAGVPAKRISRYDENTARWIKCDPGTEDNYLAA